MRQTGADDQSFPEANVRAVRALAGAVATTLGPTPRDKLLAGSQAEDTVVSSDGATVLEHLDIAHPIAPIVRRIAGPERPGETDVEGQDIPDGVTSTLVLTAALLDEAVDLLDRGVHPTTIESGYEAGLEVAVRTLSELAVPAESHERRLGVARTAMTGNDVGGLGDRWARLAVEAAEAVGLPGSETFAVSTLRTGAVDDSRLVRGAVLERNEITDERMPRQVRDATVLALDGQDEGGLRTLEFDDRYTARPDSPEQLRALQDVGVDRRERILDKLRAYGVDVVVAKQGIEKPYARALAGEGIVGVDGVTQLYLGRVARATGAAPVKRTEDFDADSLGRAGVVEELRGDPYGPDRPERRIVVFDGCHDPGSVCALLRGVWGPLAENATTELRKAVAAVATALGEDSRPGVVPGGGASEARVASAVRDRATSADGREQLVLEAFADAVEALVYSLSKNAGLDPLQARPDVRVANEANDPPHGLSLPDGEIVEATAAGIVDPFEIRRGCYTAAVELASLLVGIDDSLSATISEPAPDPDETIYEEPAEQQQSYLDDHDDTRWDS